MDRPIALLLSGGGLLARILEVRRQRPRPWVRAREDEQPPLLARRDPLILADRVAEPALRTVASPDDGQGQGRTH